ncbi:MAG: redoxin family protein [Planctomycetales bacterium]|nr:redoxin family protein [Planctomycetales bacterium]
MDRKGCCTAFLVGALVLPSLADAEVRQWTDSTGASRVTAELVAVDRDQVVLRLKGGREVRVPVEKLSRQDRDYLESRGETKPQDARRKSRRSSRGTANAAEDVAEITKAFYEDLRSEDRKAAKGLLTKDAQKLAEDGKSALAALPKPDQHTRAIRVGKASVEGHTASVRVIVRAQGQMHNTILHLQSEDGQWRVFAISAQSPGGEQTIMFEQDPTAKKDPLADLVGKPFELHGVTLAGQPLNWKQFEGKVVLVDFWATWCGPCRAEMPNVLDNYKKHHAAGFEVVAVSVDKDLDALKSFLLEQQPPWTVLADRHPRNPASMSRQLGITGIPAFVLVGQDGRVAAVHCRGKRLGAELEKLLGDPERKVALR